MARTFLGCLFAAALTHGVAYAERWTFQHVTLIDGTGAVPRPDMTIVVDGDRLVTVRPSARAGAPSGRVIEGRGKYPIPGLYWQTQTPILEDNLRRIAAAGGVVALRTDGTNGAAVQRELQHLSQAGIPKVQVIRIAPYNAARLLGRQDEMGSIAEGKIADAVLLDADPIANIDNAKKIALVMKDGPLVDESRLPLAGGAQRRRYLPRR